MSPGGPALKITDLRSSSGSAVAMANSREQLRKAGATTWAMLAAAAAREWSVPAAEITVERGVRSHARTGRRATFGELASKAAALPPPADVALTVCPVH